VDNERKSLREINYLRSDMFLTDQPFSKMAPPIAKSWIRHCTGKPRMSLITLLLWTVNKGKAPEITRRLQSSSVHGKE